MRRLVVLLAAITIASLLVGWLVGWPAPSEPSDRLEGDAESRELPPPRLGSPAMPDTGGLDPRGPPDVEWASPPPRQRPAPRLLSLTFTVVHAEDQTPIEGAVLRTASGSVALTDERGIAIVESELGTNCAVRKPGFMTMWAGADRLKSSSEHVSLHPAPALAGQVLDADSGAPIAAAEVFSRFRDAVFGYPCDSTQATDEEGRFQIAGVPAGRMITLQVVKPGFAVAEVHAGAPIPPAAPIEIRMGKGASLAGRVRTQVHPVARATVLVSERSRDLPVDATPSAFGVIAVAVTDGDGRFVIRGLSPPLEVVVHARAPGSLQGRSAPIVIHDDGAHRDVEVEVGVPGSIAVQIVDGATQERSPITAPDCSLDSVYSWATAEQRATNWNDDGDALFEGVTSGTHTVFVSVRDDTTRGYLKPRPRQVEVKPGKVAHVRFVLRRGRTVTGRVLDADGNRLRASVRFKATFGGVRQQARARSDEGGNFTLLGVPPVSGVLSIGDSNWRRTWKEIELSGDLGDLVLSDGYAALIGRLRRAPGLGAPDYGARTLLGELVHCSLRIEEGGAFRVRGLRGDEPCNLYLIDGSRNRQFVLRDVLLEPGEVRDIGEVRLADLCALEGRVLDDRGVPLAGALVKSDEMWHVCRARTDEAGRFRIGGLLSGPATLWIEPEPLVVHLHDIQVRAGMDPADIRLPEPGALRLRVGSSTGEAVPRAPVLIVRVGPPGRSMRGPGIVRWTDHRGVLTMSLSPGRYLLTPHSPLDSDVTGVPSEVRIRRGLATHVECTLPWD